VGRTASYTNQGNVIGYGTLLDVALAENFRRNLERSQRLSRIALIVAVGAAVLTTLLAAAAATIAAQDPTADRVEDVRELVEAILRELQQRR
jgi:hypothetical protein